jgi:glycosyltransferase involved in cell wall biosynthesis
MKILFLSQYFFPENFKGNDLVFELVSRGHEVVVVTGKPNYPQGKFFPGYGIFNKHKEIIGGATVYRLPLIPRGKGGAISLALNYFSFYLSSAVFFLLGKPAFDYDVIITQQLSPMTSALPGIWYKNRRKKPLVTWVLDLWPESITATTPIKSGPVINWLERLVKKLYSASDILLISSQSFRDAIGKRNINPEKIIHFPNWAEDVFNAAESQQNFQTLPKGFNIVYAGNLGEAQDFPNVINCIKTFKAHAHIHWNFVGDGRFKETLVALKDELGLDNVHLYPQHPIEFMPSLFSQADAMLLTLKGDSLISQTVPAKLQAYMSAGKMILAMIDGEANTIIQEAGCGFAVPAADHQRLAEVVIQAASLSEAERQLMQNNSLQYYQEHFTKSKAVSKVEKLLQQWS